VGKGPRAVKVGLTSLVGHTVMLVACVVTSYKDTTSVSVSVVGVVIVCVVDVVVIVVTVAVSVVVRMVVEMMV
jgi:hypothetical protein